MPRLGECNPEKDAEKWLNWPSNRIALKLQPIFYALFLPGELYCLKIEADMITHIEKLVVKMNAELQGL